MVINNSMFGRPAEPQTPAPQQREGALPALADLLPKSGVAPRAVTTCRTCPFSQRIDMKTIECWGAPPTPVVTGFNSENVRGQPNPVISLLRPRMSADTAACSIPMLAAR